MRRRPRKVNYELFIEDFKKNHLSRKELVEKYQICRSACYRILKMYGYTKKGRKSTVFLDKDFLEEHYIKLNKNVNVIAEEFAVSKTAIRNALIKHKIKIKKRNRTYVRHRDYSTKSWKGHGELSGTIFSKIRSRAKRGGIDFDVNVKMLWELFLKQNRKCALTGVDLKFRYSEGHFIKEDQTASLDRIDSSKGYVEGNIQWVHKEINQLKWSINQEKFIHWCKLVSNYNNEEAKNVFGA